MAIAVWFAVLSLAQTDESLVAAAKSPATLADFLKSGADFDWQTVWKVLGVRDPVLRSAPCPADWKPCPVELVQTGSPDQVILIAQAAFGHSQDVYLRFDRQKTGEWKCEGAWPAESNEDFHAYKIMRAGQKRFLRISSNRSQVGFLISHIFEEWFDLTQPGFQPVFSITTEGGHSAFGFGVSRDVKTDVRSRPLSGVDQLEVDLNVVFNGLGLQQQNVFRGVYQRQRGERNFRLVGAFSGKKAIPTSDFLALADPFDGLSNQLVRYALPALRKVASGSDMQAKEWLRSFLRDAADTAAKRELLILLKR
ncbi:hypothetical protein F183_A27050 [Bryobacterales bacterium F-183]|nr:hypothetical protein F183_A27050 [Bryobacterales bacterium F-183]